LSHGRDPRNATAGDGFQPSDLGRRVEPQLNNEVGSRHFGNQMRVLSRRALSSAGTAMVLLLLGLAAVTIIYFDSSTGSADQISTQNQQIAALKSEVQQLAASLLTGKNVTFPVVNQQPTIRSVRETWYLSPSAHQDRFDPAFIVVNQGDTIRLTFIDNDTVAHDFVIGPPYNVIVNATVPGLVNDLTGQKFTTPARNNSPGVVVQGTPGSVSASYSFVANYSGIYEFVCTYHAEVGMIGYLVVLPNAAFTSVTTHSTTGLAPETVKVAIVSGAGTNTSSKGFSPPDITVVLGVNNTVAWTNGDTSPHTVTADDGSFYSGNLAPGSSFTYTFTSTGIYAYHCTYHPWMTGIVTVKAGT
jgi:plastocyanin